MEMAQEQVHQLVRADLDTCETMQTFILLKSIWQIISGHNVLRIMVKSSISVSY